MMVASADKSRQAAELFSKTWQEALELDIPLDLLAGTALSAALASLVRLHGREAAARMTDRFSSAIREGKFDHGGHSNGGDAA